MRDEQDRPAATETRAAKVTPFASDVEKAQGGGFSTNETHAALEDIYRAEKRRVLATLVRLLGGFDAAEEALQDAFSVAAEVWARDGVPQNPYSWLVSTGRFRTVDRWRRQARLAAALPDLEALEHACEDIELPEVIQDDELRLLFICCHPAIGEDARIALTLREFGGLTTEEIARAYLCRASTIAQRIVRAKAQIREEALPYEVPAHHELPARIDSVLRVIYLIFNEGYAATEGASAIREELISTALRLGRSAAELLADPEADGLLALMLLHEARKAARLDANGDLILLEDQDRALWDQGGIRDAQRLIERGFAVGRVGSYLLQASIAATHSSAPRFGETDWRTIVSLYDMLARIEPTPVVKLNRAVALGMRDGYVVGLAAIDDLMNDGSLDQYCSAHAARADMQRRLGMIDAARQSYQRALALTRQAAEQRFLSLRLAQVSAANARSPGPGDPS